MAYLHRPHKILVVISAPVYISNNIYISCEKIHALSYQFTETINKFLQVSFDPSRSCFSCLFAESVGNGSKSCNIVYGLKDPVTDESNGCFSSVNSVKSKAEKKGNIGYFDPHWLHQLHALILASLSIGNVCYLLYIPSGKH